LETVTCAPEHDEPVLEPATISQYEPFERLVESYIGKDHVSD
jgi:hypothetical protein